MPTLIVVEDGHWLDDASRLLLRSLTASPVLATMARLHHDAAPP